MQTLEFEDPLLSKLHHLRLPTVTNLVGCSERTWLRWVKNNQAPRPVRLGPGVVVWRLLDLQAWLENKGVDA